MEPSLLLYKVKLSIPLYTHKEEKKTEVIIEKFRLNFQIRGVQVAIKSKRKD
jgi:hypothetical protein